MNIFRNVAALWVLGLTAAFAPGCSSEPTDEEQVEDEGALTTSKQGQWVVNLKKVKELYGSTSKYFFGLAPEEVGLCKVDANGQPEASCAKIPPVFDQVFHYNEDHTPVPADSWAPILKMEGSPDTTPEQEALGLKVKGGIASVKGARLNIIPMLRDTDPTDQAHIRAWMQNGDVQVYFHPETRDTKGQMDRRASHVAMFYDYKKADGREFVHHVDNPNSYGPQFNHAPDRQMPFHIFRFKPKGMSAEQSKAYGLNSRNWAFITDDRSPFADFFTLTLQSYDDLVKKFKEPALRGEEIAKVYCSGLAFTNLNLGVNFPIKPNMLRAEGYSRAEIEEPGLKADVLAPASTQGLSPAYAGRERLVFDPYTTSDLTNAWIDNTYAALPAVAPEGQPSRRAIANNPKTQEGVLGGLQSLAWSDAERTEKAQQHIDVSKVATPARVKAWADAYGLTATDTQAWLQRNAEIATQVTEERIDPSGKTPMQVLRQVELATVSNRFVGPRIWADEADHRQWAFDPRMLAMPGMVAPKAEVDLVYVGTVLNCELLASANGNQASACLGTGGRIKEFTEGGADTSTYPHYAVANGAERTHRRFDASPFSRGKDRDGTNEPRSFGKGTKISVRATATEASDLLVLFHTPAMNASLPEDVKKLPVKEYDKFCTKGYAEAAAAGRRSSCAPKQAIVLDLKKTEEVAQGWAKAEGKIVDSQYTFDLSKACTFTSETKMKCIVAEQKADGSGWEVKGEQEVSREIPKVSKTGLVALTLADQGAKSEGADVDSLCPACQRGGAHFNQWTLTVRND